MRNSACSGCSCSGQGALDGRFLLFGLEARLVLRTRRAAIVEHRFVADELVTVLLQNGARESLAAHHENRFVVLLELVDESDKIAVAAHDAESVDVIVGKRQFERVERQIDVRAVLIAARRRVALHHLYGVLGELGASSFRAYPSWRKQFW